MMEKELQDYVNGVSDYEPISNLFFQNKDAYYELGKYIIDVFGDDLPEDLKKLNMFKGGKIKKFSLFKKNDTSFVSILFLTSVIDSNALRKLFGEPIYHDEFGEGFSTGEYDEETEEDIEPDIKESFASYFVEIEGVKFHIGYDNRGTSIEIEAGSTFDQTLNCIKKLILMCKDVL